MEDLSKNSKLLHRNGRYYFRTRVPKDVVALIGKKEIKVSLRTSDLREAKLKLPMQQIAADKIFEDARKQVKVSQKSISITLNRIEIERTIILWHQDEIARYTAEDDLFRLNSTPEERIQVIDNLREDLSVLDGGDESQYSSGIQTTIKQLLPELDKKKQFDEYVYAQSLIQQSLIEQTYNRLEKYGDYYTRTPFNLFLTRNANLSNLPSPKGSKLSLSTLIAKFKLAKKSEGLTEKTMTGYKLMFDFSTELFGHNTPVADITPEDCRKFKDELLKLPANARKLYPTLSLIDSIEAHSKFDTGTLSDTSVNGHLIKLTTLLGFAQKEGFIDKNPCDPVKKIKANKRRPKSRQPFTESALIKLFNAPIFTGCVDDEWNYKSVGLNQPRRHKFWLPLIALYSGMRLNEICQLFVSDIDEVEGISVIHVRLDETDEKRLKNDNSERVIPIHNQLIKIGFMDYVSRIKSQGHKRLFPDLSQSSQGSYSDNFSKWFNRFLKSQSIKANGACFHSFRHSFRDAVREAHIPREVGAALGGWKISEDVMDDYGAGYKLATLNKNIQKIHYGKVCQQILEIPKVT